MKKGGLSTGLISAIVFFAGIIFKKLHYPGASILLSLGALIGIVFLIMYLINGTKFLKIGIEKSNAIIATITMIFIIVGFLFKVQHWPGGHIVLIVSHICLLISSIVMFIDAYMETEEKKQSTKAFIAFSYFILMLMLVSLAIFFDGFQPPM